MGAPKLNRVKLKQTSHSKKVADSKAENEKNKQIIQQYVEKIKNSVKKEDEAKKLAQILSEVINSNKK